MYTGSFIKKQRCRDEVINDFLSQSRHLLVPLLFHELTSLHPPSFQRNDFSKCILSITILSDMEALDKCCRVMILIPYSSMSFNPIVKFCVSLR